ncbi:MAG: fasciclin domain-containing protein [Polyangiales bacterium]
MKDFVGIAVIGGLVCGLLIAGCKKQEVAPAEAAPVEEVVVVEASNVPPLHENNIVSIAIGSKDHTTLVAALKAADYVTSVAASGPLTVFAPTNDAFAKLPEGTVENLVKPENVGTLREILKYHVTTSAVQPSWFKEGQALGMANGKKATMHVNGEELSLNDAKIIARIPAENGMLYVVDTVLLPPEE